MHFNEKNRREMVLAIMSANNKEAEDKDSAIAEKKFGSFPLLHEGIQAAVHHGYLRIFGGDNTPKYYVSDSGKDFVQRIDDILDEDELD